LTPRLRPPDSLSGGKALRQIVSGLCLLLVTVGPGLARTAAERAELRAAQQALFARLVERPDDLSLMFDYAAVSMRLEDYEPAIATLERMLIFNPDLPRVKLELGVAYFRLGAYDVARFYFNEVLGEGPPDEVVARVTPFIDAINARTTQSAFSGFVSLGPVYSSNATLGPDDRNFRADFGGIVVPDATISANPEADFGLRLSAVLNHRYDLQRPNDDAWLSSAVYTGLRYESVEEGEFDAVDLKTGPRLALDDRAFGPKARPFAQLGFVRSADEALYGLGGGGVDYSDTLDERLAAFANATLQYREFQNDSNDFDGWYTFLTGGVSYTGVQDVALNGSLFFETDRTEEAFTSNVEVGLRLTAAREFSLADVEGFSAFALPMRASAFLQASRRLFDEPNPVIEPDITRADTDLRFGGRLLTPFEDSWAVAVDASWFERNSRVSVSELENFEIGFSVIKSF